MQPLFTSAGGYLFGRDAEGNYDPNDLGLNTPESIAAAQKIFDLGESGANVLRRSVSNDNAISLFAEGNAACLISGPWALADVRAGLGEDGYTVQPIPGLRRRRSPPSRSWAPRRSWSPPTASTRRSPRSSSRTG